MRFRKILLISVLILFMVDFSFASSNQTISIALITDRASGLDESPLVSLLEVELSQKEGVQLLERAEIDTILEEQKLSAAGLLDRNATIKVGKLLRADVFIILTLENEIEDANNLIRVRVAETAHGLRLLDYFEQPDGTNPQESVENIVQKIETIINKLNQPDDKLIPIGIVDIHRVELGDKYKMLERTLPTLLSIRLSLEPQIIMLEREDLKVLLDEKLRTEGEDSEFWNSAVLIDGYMQPHNGQLEMKLQLKQADGNEIMTCSIPVEPNEALVAISKAAVEIVEKLQDTPPLDKWNPELEAEQFYQQGQMLERHKRYEKTLSLYETAHALVPNNVFYTGAMFGKIWGIRRRIDETLINNEIGILKYEEPGKCPYSDIEIVDIVSVLVRQIRDGYKQGLLTSNQIYYNLAESLGNDIIFSGGYFSKPASVSTEEIRQINRINRKIWIDTFSEAIRHQVINQINPLMNNYTAVRLVWLSSDDPNELIQNIKKAVNENIMPPELGGRIKSEKRRKEIFEQTIGSNQKIFSPDYFNHYTYLKGSGDIIVRLIKDYLEELTYVNDSVVSIESKLLLIQDYEEFLDDLKDKLKSSKPNDSNFNSEAMKDLFVKLYYRVNAGKITIDEMIEIWEETCGYLVDNNDIDALSSLLLVNVSGPFTMILEIIDRTSQEQIYERYYSLLKRISQKLLPYKKNRNINTAVNNLRGIQVEMERKFPGLAGKAKNGVEVTMLLTKKDWMKDISSLDIIKQFSRSLFQIKIQDEMLWIAMELNNRFYYNMRKQDNIGLIGIDLKQRRVVSFWEADDLHGKRICSLSGLLVNATACYLSLQEIGIVEFPSNLKKGKAYLNDPNVYSLKNGLPSLDICSIALDGEKLWVAYGAQGQESGLGLYNLNTEEWKTIFCSTLKDNPPLSDGQPYHIFSLWRVNPNNLLFYTDYAEQAGLWKLNTDNYDLTYLGPVTKSSLALSGDIIDGKENKLLIKSSSFLAEFDTDTENVKIIYGNAYNLRREYEVQNLVPPDYDKSTDLKFLKGIYFGSYVIQGALDLSTATIHNNKVWARLGPNQIAIIEMGKSFEDAQIIDNKILDGGAVHRFVSTPYGLVAIGEGAVGLIEDEEK